MKNEKILNQFIMKIFRVPAEGMAYILAKTPVTPNQVSTLGLLLLIPTCLLLATGAYMSQFIASIMAFSLIVIDYADGSVGRRKGLTSAFGDWFDAMIDEIREFFIILSLAFGLYRAGADYKVWIFAFVILGADAMVMRVVNKFYKLVDVKEHVEGLKRKLDTNIFIAIAKELISVRALRYVLFPVFAWFGALFLYLKCFAAYGAFIAVGFLFYYGWTLWTREKKGELKT